jgi:deazaflavin-dependent oxidoreductase (nitroreductase family)
MAFVQRKRRVAARAKAIVGRVEAAEIRLTGTSVLGGLSRTDVLVLVTRGRKSGRERRTPVAYIRTTDGWLIAGGANGQPRVDWVANLRTTPAARVIVGRREHHVTAFEPVGDDYDRARADVVSRWPRVSRYEAQAGRKVPVFDLRPSSSPS